MRYHFLVIMSLMYFVRECSVQRTILDNIQVPFKEFVLSFIGRTATTKGLRSARRLHKVQPQVEEYVPFPCQTKTFRSTERPSSVHQLRPGDFDVIAGLGDSLTAANGAAASRYLHITIENRGLAWSIGGQGDWRKHLTLANILKEFNPNLVGFSLRDSNTHHRGSQFNVAEPGSMSRDMPYMAKILVKRIQADKRVNFTQDWKLVTMMIGANDFCADICYRPDPSKTPEQHKLNLMQTLDYLRDNLPRTLVNLVNPPNIDILVKFKGKKPYCEAMHILECPCFFGMARVKSRIPLIKVIKRWQQVEEELALDSRYQKTDDFAVVLQPFVTKITFPERETPDGNLTDWSYLSEDCFHFSQKGYARASNALWNNMLEPVGQKSTDWTDTFKKFLCPSETSPYVFTWQNSGSTSTRKQL